VRSSRLASPLAILLTGLLVINANEASASSKSSHHHNGSATPLERGQVIDRGACGSIAKDMRQAANADVTKSDARSFVTSTDKALRLDRASSQLKKMAHDAEAFEKSFAKSPFNPVTLAMVQDCAASGIRAPLIPPTSSSTSTAQSSAAAISAVTSLVESSLSLPANEITVTIDNDQPSWAYWTVNNPNVGTAYGFSQLIGGTWEIVAGPGSFGVGCPGGGQGQAVIPPQVMTYFGTTCPPTGSGNSGTSGSTGNTGSVTQPTISTSAAYNEGYLWGQQITSNPGANGAGLSEFEASAACKKNFPGDPAAQSAYYSGCMSGAGY
jgi:hypothetical protein